ncbi:MAG: hypothetical protein WC454_04730 [Phycisphaerae bacterium]|jgi:uncharacterized membrane protein
MNGENTQTSLGKWSAAFALIPLTVVTLFLLYVMISMWLEPVSGESGLAVAGIIGMALYVASHIICITSLTGIGLAIAAIYKTSRRQGRTGLLLNIAMLIITVAFWLWIRFHY